MIIKTWSDAQHKLNEIFSNNKKTRDTIRGELLKKSEQDRLDYFVGDNEEIESALLTLLPGKYNLLVIIFYNGPKSRDLFRAIVFHFSNSYSFCNVTDFAF